MLDFIRDAATQHLRESIMGLGSLVALLTLMWLRRYFVTWKAYDVRQKKVDQRLEEHAERLRRQGEQLGTLQNSMNGIADSLSRLPTKEDIHALHVAQVQQGGELREIRADVKGMKTLMERQDAEITLMHQHLLDKNR